MGRLSQWKEQTRGAQHCQRRVQHQRIRSDTFDLRVKGADLYLSLRQLNSCEQRGKPEKVDLSETMAKLQPMPLLLVLPLRHLFAVSS